MAKRKIDEEYMKTLLVEGMPYKPARKSSVSDEQRMAILDEIDGTVSPVSEPSEVETPKPVTRSKRTTSTPKETTPDKGYNGIVSMESYRDTFFKKRNAKAKTSFLADKEVLQVLRYILLDTESSTSLSDYVGNILTHHISEYKELINGATDKNLRKQTIPEL